jgi:PPK2 family polyphosphate:nucleotide phosphotransferase
MAQPLIPNPLQPVRLADFDPAWTDGYTKEQAKAEEARLEERLFTLQEMLYASAEQSLLIIFQAMDAGGKDGAIKQVFRGVNPQGIIVTSFKAPTSQDLAHDYLWRIHQRVPPKGYIGVFNRSHYEDVLVVRVNGLAPEPVWAKRYDHINDFERMLSDSGTRILKIYLHISKDEQKERFEERLAQPDKHWKFNTGDLAVRTQWDAYMQAYEDVLTRCNTAYAPWAIIPANRKWYRDLAVTRLIVETLESMNLRYSPAEAGLEHVVIPD